MWAAVLPPLLANEVPLAVVFVYGTLKTGQVNWPHWLGHAVEPPCHLADHSGGLATPRAVLLGPGTTNERFAFFTNPPVYAAGDAQGRGAHSSPIVLQGAIPEPHDPSLDYSPDGYRFTYPQRVQGEVYAIFCPTLLEELDDLEGVTSGVYSRTMVGCSVRLPHDTAQITACIYTRATLYPTRGIESIIADQCGYVGRPAVEAPWSSAAHDDSPGVFEASSLIETPAGAKRRLACFLASFDVELSVRHSHYPAGYSYLVPHLRPASRLVPGAFKRGLSVRPPAPIVLVLLDGVGDYTSYGGQHALSPLGAACPSAPFHRVASAGVSGLMDPSRCGLACGSDTAHLSLLGYRPEWYYRGRGSFEAIGAGLDMRPGDVAFKCNFATIGDCSSDGGDPLRLWDMVPETMPTVLRRRADRNFTEEGPVLCGALNNTIVKVHCGTSANQQVEYKVLVQYATEHRCGIVIRGVGLGDEVTGTDPLVDNKPLHFCEPKRGARDPACAQRTSAVVNAVTEAIHRILVAHPVNASRVAAGKPPANIVLLRGAALLQEGVATFAEMHGMRGFAVAPTCIIRGLSKCVGLDVFDVPRDKGATGDTHSNVLAKAELAVEILSGRHSGCSNDVVKGSYQFGFVHLKGVDDAGHEGNAEVKAALLSPPIHPLGGSHRAMSPPPSTASDVVEFLIRNLPNGTTLVITGDHTTPCVLGDHSTEAVPVAMAKVGSLTHNEGPLLTEVSCELGACGSLGRFEGSELMGLVKRFHQGGR